MSDTPHHNATTAARLPAPHPEPSKSMTRAQITLGTSAQTNEVYPQDESSPVTLASVIQALRAHALASTSIGTTPVLDEPIHERIAHSLPTPDADDSYTPRFDFESFVEVDKGKSRAVEDCSDAPDALCSPSTTLSSIDTLASFESNPTSIDDEDIASMLLIQQMLAEQDEQLALLLFEEEAMAMSPSYAGLATKGLTSPQDRQAALTKLAVDAELAAPMQTRSLVASTSQSPPGVTPLSDEEYENNKKRILKEIDEEIARRERKKRRQSEAARRRRNRNASNWMRSWSV